MRLPLLLARLAPLLVLSILSCAKHPNDPAPAPVSVANTGSYKLDGQLVVCPKIAVYEYPNRGGMGADELQIQLLTQATAQYPNGDNMLLSFVKGAGDPVSAYYFNGVTHIIWPGSSGSPQTRSFVANRQCTLAATASGGYSGTFACTSPGSGSISTSQLTEGTFTDVHP